MDHEDVPFDCFHSYLFVIRANRFLAMHYHKKQEWIALTYVRVKILIEDISSKERKEIILYEYSIKYSLIYIPPKIAHIIKNIGNIDSSIFVFSKTIEIHGDTDWYEKCRCESNHSICASMDR